jgi:hypothetical protein
MRGREGHRVWTAGLRGTRNSISGIEPDARFLLHPSSDVLAYAATAGLVEDDSGACRCWSSDGT